MNMLNISHREDAILEEIDCVVRIDGSVTTPER